MLFYPEDLCLNFHSYFKVTVVYTVFRYTLSCFLAGNDCIMVFCLWIMILLGIMYLFYNIGKLNSRRVALYILMIPPAPAPQRYDYPAKNDLLLSFCLVLFLFLLPHLLLSHRKYFWEGVEKSAPACSLYANHRCLWSGMLVLMVRITEIPTKFLKCWSLEAVELKGILLHHSVTSPVQDHGEKYCPDLLTEVHTVSFARASARIQRRRRWKGWFWCLLIFIREYRRKGLKRLF